MTTKMKSIFLVCLFLSCQALAQNNTDAPLNNTTSAPSVSPPDTTNVPTQAPTVAAAIGDAIDSVTGAPTTIVTGATSVVFPGTSAPLNTTAPTVSTPSPTVTPPTPFPTYISNVEYLDDPIVKWSVQLPNTGSITESKIGTGNAVTASPENNLVYVTLSDGRLAVLSASDGSLRWEYTPPPASPGWKVRCSSNVYFGELSRVGKFAVYAIVDEAPAGLLEDNRSRVVAVSHPDNELLWISDSVPGEIQGTPIVSYFGRYVFISHNQYLNSVSQKPFGSFSILQADESGALMFTEDAGDSPSDPDPTTTRIGDLRQPYGPLGVSHAPVAGRYLGGENNLNDIIVWSTSVDEGRGGNGYTRVFQIPRLFQPVFAPSLETTFLREVRWNAVAKPVLSQDGLSLLFGVRSNSVRGWTGFNDYYENGNIVQTLTENESDIREAVQKAPAFSTAETRFFVALSVPVLNALATRDGRILWEFQGEAEFAACPKVSPDDKYVYTIQENGKVIAHEQVDGTTHWEFDYCDSAPMDVSCSNEVKGEFSLSSNGLVLYYGDLLGNVKALRLGASLTPTAAPTNFPTRPQTASPTIPGTAAPTSKITSPPTSKPTEAPSAKIVSTLPPTFPPQGETFNQEQDVADAAGGISLAFTQRALGTAFIILAIVFI